MNHPADRTTVDAAAGPHPVAAVSDLASLEALLTRAARAAAAAGVDLEEFIQVAWSAYVDSQPGMRARLEDAHLASHIADLRRRGMVGQA